MRPNCTRTSSQITDAPSLASARSARPRFAIETRPRPQLQQQLPQLPLARSPPLLRKDAESPDHVHLRRPLTNHRTDHSTPASQPARPPAAPCPRLQAQQPRLLSALLLLSHRAPSFRVRHSSPAPRLSLTHLADLDPFGNPSPGPLFPRLRLRLHIKRKGVQCLLASATYSIIPQQDQTTQSPQSLRQSSTTLARATAPGAVPFLQLHESRPVEHTYCLCAECVALPLAKLLAHCLPHACLACTC